MASKSNGAPGASSPAAVEKIGNGGELHQIASDGQDRLTTAFGHVVGDDQNGLRAGPRGPTLLEDFVLRDKITHFDHERIPERVVHARGTAAHGYFELADSLADLTTARILGEVGERTEIFTRFSTVAGSRGSVDLARDGHSEEAQPLLDKAGVKPDAGIVPVAGKGSGFVEAAQAGRVWEREPLVRTVF